MENMKIVKIVSTGGGFRLLGAWLTDSGFVPGSIVTAKAVPGLIVLQMREEGKDNFMELVEFARQNQLRIFQVRTGGKQQYIGLDGTCMKKAGFMPGQPLKVTHRFGMIHIKKDHSKGAIRPQKWE